MRWSGVRQNFCKISQLQEFGMYVHELYFTVNQVVIDVLGSLPSYVFYVILLVWFVFEIVNDVAIQRTGKGILFTHEKVNITI